MFEISTPKVKRNTVKTVSSRSPREFHFDKDRNPKAIWISVKSLVSATRAERNPSQSRYSHQSQEDMKTHFSENRILYHSSIAPSINILFTRIWRENRVNLYTLRV